MKIVEVAKAAMLDTGYDVVGWDPETLDGFARDLLARLGIDPDAPVQFMIPVLASKEDKGGS